MKKLWMIAVLTLPSVSFATDLGVAGSFGTKNEIRIVMKAFDYIIEPYLQYNEYNTETKSERDYENNTAQVGISLWKKHTINEQVYTQVGLQLGYATRESKSGHYYDNGLGGRKESDVMDGLALAPGFGLFYELNKHLDVGLEVKYSIEQLKGTSKRSTSDSPDYTWTNDENADVEQNSSTVTTSATIRLYF